jgi:hypothetical protein
MTRRMTSASTCRWPGQWRPSSRGTATSNNRATQPPCRVRRTATTGTTTGRSTHTFDEVMAWAVATAGDRPRSAVVAEAAAAGDGLRLVGSTCRGPAARERRVVVLLDAGSTATFLSPTVFQLEELEQPLECAGASGDFEVRRQGYALLWMERGAGNGWVRVNGYEPAVPAGVDVLLGNRRSTTWRGVGELSLSQLADVGVITTEAGRQEPLLPVAAWSDHLMGEFLASHPESLEDEHYDVDEVRLADELTGRQQAELRALVREYSDIFATTDVPPASTAYAETFGAVDAVSMLKEGVTRFPHASPPHFQQHHAVFLAAWTRRLVLRGVLVRHSRSPAASRALVTSRHSVTGRKPRVCLDLRALNELFAPAQGEFTNGHAELPRAARPAAYRMEADLCTAYWQIPVAPASEFLFCFWLPVEVAPGRFEAQKFAFTVVPFGWSLAPMVMQEWVAHTKVWWAGHARSAQPVLRRPAPALRGVGGVRGRRSRRLQRPACVPRAAEAAKGGRTILRSLAARGRYLVFGSGVDGAAAGVGATDQCLGGAQSPRHLPSLPRLRGGHGGDAVADSAADEKGRSI